MFIEKDKISREEIKKVSVIINIILIILFVFLFFVFWNIQILKNNQYQSLANKNIYKDVEIKAPRGLILDRNYKILSENKINFSLCMIRENIVDIKKSISFASTVTGIDEKEIIRRIEKYKNFPKFYMIPIKRNLSMDKVIFIESRSDKFPEFKIEIEPTRAYPNKMAASHILGYISEITNEELSERKDYRLGDYVGKSGIEKQYELVLRGSKGFQTVVKDNEERIHEIIYEEKPSIGNTVILTIDINLQKYILDLLGDQKGTVGLVDLNTGGILALVSTPKYNPEFFSSSFRKEEWLAIVNDPDNPLHNKFIQGLYSPGSIFKIIVALTGLEEDVVDTRTRVKCTGAVNIYNRLFNCWKESGHGTMDIYSAIQNSCNIFFYQLGKQLDIDIIARYAEMMGLGKKTEIDLPNEKSGLVPTKAWKLKNLNEKWFSGETISVSIGHGMLNVTPAQALQMISTVALRGEMPQLHLIKRIEKNGKVVEEFKPIFKKVPIKKENFEIVIKGLYKVVNEGGTGRAAKVEGLDICGKTGTSQIIAKENPEYKKLVKQKRFTPHSWFVSFAPRNDPKVALVVFIENGGDAGIIAAPIAAKIYRKYFRE